MTREFTAGAVCGDVLVGGEKASMMPNGGHITHQGTVPRPSGPQGPEDVLWTRVTIAGGFGICGQGHDSGLAWQWRDGVWTDHGPTNGVSPCIFDLSGALQVVRPGPDVTSQGYRYVDAYGRIWLGDETYADKDRQIWEYTTVAGVTIGQGESGCHVLIDGTRRLLEAGDTRFIRVDYRDDRFAIAIQKPDGVVRYWLTRGELAALPLVAPSVPDTPPVPPDTPEVPPVSDMPDVGLMKRLWAELGMQARLDAIAGTGPRPQNTEAVKRVQATFLALSAQRMKANGLTVFLERHEAASGDPVPLKAGGEARISDVIITNAATPSGYHGEDVMIRRHFPGQSSADFDDEIRCEPGNGGGGSDVGPRLDPSLVDTSSLTGGAQPPVDPPVEPPVDPPVPPVTPDPDALAALRAAVDALRADLVALDTSVDSRLSALNLENVAHKGDSVTVSGKLPWVGNVTAHGSIDA